MSLSHVRIVRVSFVQGEVAVLHSKETDWSAATVNTPIQEGFSVATSANAFAEVEFENGSTARLGQASQISFPQLALTNQGDRINKLELTKGYATFHFTPEHHDQYEVDASGVTITVHGKAEFRTNYTGDSLRVEVFDGEVQAAHDGKTEALGKNRVLTYDPNAVEAMSISEGVQKDSWDKWTQARDQQAVLASNDESVSLNGPLFGWGDLDTYGDWNFFPGYGYGWAPYEPMGWSPYANGMWGYYSGWGFTWISAEPWGWLPFHNGFWNYDASMGWFWMPGPMDAWSPAMVNWYQGDGWVGWAPMGANGSAACSIGAAGCLTAVSPTALSSGAPIRPTSPLIVHPAPTALKGMTRTGEPQFVTAAGRPASAAAISAQMQAGRVAAPSAASASASTAIHAAPTSVVMGKEVSADSFLAHRGSAFSRAFGSGGEPIHAAMGRTMGGTFPTVVNHNGEVSPSTQMHAGSGPQGNFAPRMPSVMAHAAGGGAPSAQMGPRGGISPVAPVSASAPSAPRAGASPSSGNGAASTSSSAAAAPAPRSSSAPAASPMGGHK
jgi:hypothetical protein